MFMFFKTLVNIKLTESSGIDLRKSNKGTKKIGHEF